LSRASTPLFVCSETSQNFTRTLGQTQSEQVATLSPSSKCKGALNIAGIQDKRWVRARTEVGVDAVVRPTDGLAAYGAGDPFRAHTHAAASSRRRTSLCPRRLARAAPVVGLDKKPRGVNYRRVFAGFGAAGFDFQPERWMRQGTLRKGIGRRRARPGAGFYFPTGFR